MVAVAAPVREVRAPARSTWAAAWPWIRALAGIGIFGAVAWKLGTGSIVDGFRAVTVPSVLAALLIGFATTALSAQRWRIVADRFGDALPFGQAVRGYYRALFLNNVLPAGVLGDVHRAVTHGVPAVVVERAAGQIVIAAAALVAVTAGPSLGGLTGYLLLAVVVLTAVLVGGWLLLRKDRRTALGGAVPAVLWLSTACLAGHVTLFVVAARAAGVTAPLTDLVPLLVIALLAMGLPVNVAGWGPREGATAVLFGAAGLGSAAGLSASIGYGVLGLVASLPGLFLLRRKETP